MELLPLVFLVFAFLAAAVVVVVMVVGFLQVGLEKKNTWTFITSERGRDFVLIQKSQENQAQVRQITL